MRVGSYSNDVNNYVDNNNYNYYKQFQNEGSITWASPERFSEYFRNPGVSFSWGESNPDLVETGLVYNTYDALTAAMDENSRLRMTGDKFAFDQSVDVLNGEFTNVGLYSKVNAINSPSMMGQQLQRLPSKMYQVHHGRCILIVGFMFTVVCRSCRCLRLILKTV